MSKHDDDYINKYDQDQTPEILTNRAMYSPLVYGGLSILCIIIYFFAITTADKAQILVYAVPFMSVKGLIVTLISFRYRHSYIVWWRIGFTACLGSLIISLVIILLALLRFISITGV